MKRAAHIVDSLLGDDTARKQWKLTKKEADRLDGIAKTDPHAATVELLGGKLVTPSLPSREKWNAMLADYAPGCGSRTFVPGTNGGTFACGSTINGKQEFCDYCKQPK